MSSSKESKSLHNIHDKFFRQSFEDPAVLKDFLKTHLPKQLLHAINLKKITVMPKSFISTAGRDLEADLICKITLHQRTGFNRATNATASADAFSGITIHL